VKSSTDSLTGLHNRRGFYKSAHELMVAAMRDSALCFTVVMIDLDDFKRVNDTLGHTTGDRILVAVADRLRAACRGDAVIARAGGEEFLLAHATQMHEARETVERIRLAIASTSWGVTASLGMASRVAAVAGSDSRQMIERLVEAADAAMYEAKRAGGNQIRRSDDRAA
jgi:diguanylate cyclase (GGDEF)-like protein